MMPATVLAKREQLVGKIILAHDTIRINAIGGYCTDWVIDNGKVYWADLDPSKDYQRTELIVLPIRDFIRQHGWALRTTA